MTDSGTAPRPERADAVIRVKAFGLLFAAVFASILAYDALYFAYVWGERGSPVMHIGLAALAAVPCAAVIYGVREIAGRFPTAAWSARLHTPRWSALEPFFKCSKILLSVVVLSYVLFYVTQGVNEQTKWAVWVNEHILNFYLFCRHFTAIEVIRIEIAGYTLYLVLHGIYNYYCPPILAHSIRKSGGLAREDAALVFVRTIERHGEAIPSADLANTIAAFATESRGLFDDDTKILLDSRLAHLKAVARVPTSGAAANLTETAQAAAGLEQPPVTADDPAEAERGRAIAVTADAAAVARLFPSRLAMETYYLGVDLFDILYPVVRGLLCVGLVVAILATSLPVAAKLLWVAFPRLGEPCMANVMQIPPDFRDSEWVEFEGKFDTRGPVDVVLIPEDDANERWTLAKQDVVEIPTDEASHIFLRIGGVVKGVKIVGIPSGSSPPPPGFSSRMSTQCGTAGSRCSNHVEICCGSNVIRGGCYGRWPCPAP